MDQYPVFLYNGFLFSNYFFKYNMNILDTSINYKFIFISIFIMYYILYSYEVMKFMLYMIVITAGKW